eukprot:1175944-Prorocentrum_minimum.AAC.3
MLGRFTGSVSSRRPTRLTRAGEYLSVGSGLYLQASTARVRRGRKRRVGGQRTRIARKKAKPRHATTNSGSTLWNHLGARRISMQGRGM